MKSNKIGASVGLAVAASTKPHNLLGFDIYLYESLDKPHTHAEMEIENLHRPSLHLAIV